MNAQQFASFVQALPATEGGPGTLSGQQNNPGAIKDGKFAQAQPGYAGSNKGYAVFKTPQAGMAAMQKLLTNGYYNKGQQSIRDIIEGKPVGGQTAPSQTAQAAQSGGPRLLLPGKDTPAPNGFQWKDTTHTTLEPIPGGPADPNAQPDTLDDATTTFYAEQILAGAPMPTLGMGKAAAQARQAILKKVAQIAGGDGLTGKDLAVQVAHYKANLVAVQNLEKNAGSIEQNEQTALMNGQQFLERSKELPGQTSMPAVNSIIQSGQRHLPVAGHDTVIAMDNAYNTFVNEYAKVVAGSPSGAGVLSDSARKEAMETMRGNYAYSQKVAAFNQMKADMANRMAAIRATIAERYKNLGERAPGIGANPKGAAPNNVESKVLNGKTYYRINGKWFDNPEGR
jgi:hypothetical protein